MTLAFALWDGEPLGVLIRGVTWCELFISASPWLQCWEQTEGAKAEAEIPFQNNPGEINWQLRPEQLPWEWFSGMSCKDGLLGQGEKERVRGPQGVEHLGQWADVKASGSLLALKSWAWLGHGHLRSLSVTQVGKWAWSWGQDSWSAQQKSLV